MGLDLGDRPSSRPHGWFRMPVNSQRKLAAPGSRPRTYLGIHRPAGRSQAGSGRRGPLKSTGSPGDSAGPGRRAALRRDGQCTTQTPRLGGSTRARMLCLVCCVTLAGTPPSLGLWAVVSGNTSDLTSCVPLLLRKKSGCGQTSC